MTLGTGFHFTTTGLDRFSSIGATHSQQTGGATTGQVQTLNSQIERLLMITEALWTFMKEQHSYTDEDLIKAIATIDMRDGRLDGKVRDTADGVETCSECGRPVGARHTSCIYCGTPMVRDPFDR